MSVPKIVIDARMVFEQGHGISEYLLALLQGIYLIKNRPYEIILLGNPKHLHSRLQNSFEIIEPRSGFLSPRECFELPFLLKSLKAKLYHSPSFSSLLTSPCPWIITIHDLNHLHYGNFGKKLYYQILLKRFAKKAKKIITVSDFSRNEIASWLHVSKQKIEIIENIFLNKSDHSRNSLKMPNAVEPYFLCLSGSKPHKNKKFVQQACSKSPIRIAFIDELPSDLLPYRNNIETLMCSSVAVICPSLYEGFGRVPLEAILSGRPVLVSDIPAHKEAIGKVGIGIYWFDPKDEESLRKWVFLDQAYEPPLQEDRTKIMQRFSIELIANKMDKVYRDVLRTIV